MRNANLAGLSRRTAILAAAAMLVAARMPIKRTPRILFVCLHGTVKSPIAREIMRRAAKAKGFAVHVRSRGIEPADAASPELSAALVRDQIDVHRDHLIRLRSADADWADVTVFFDNLPPWFAAPARRDWTDTPSVNQHYAAASELLHRRIDALLDELAAGR